MLGLFGAAALVITAGACGDDQVGVAPTVSISGAYSVEVGKTLTLTAASKNGSDTSYTWTSSDENVATVNAQGEVTAVAAGETTITATGAETKASGTHGIVVIEKGTVTPGDPVVTVTGDLVVKPTEAITLTAKTTNGTDSGYDWKSSDEKIATVDDTGKVTGIVEGDVQITATGKDTKKEATVPVYVRTTVPNLDAWKTSAHAAKDTEAFTHWDADTPPEIPTSCARCHSTDGYQDYLGADGSEAFKVDKAAKIGTTVECRACHNSAAAALSEVTFPSGVKLTGLGPEARCMTCHQGRASSDSVEKAITDEALATADTVSANLRFINIHYYAAGATLNAGKVRGGYQYTGQVYDVRFRHVPTHQTCVGCHDAHSLKVKIDECKTCHTGVNTVADLKKIRMIDSKATDFDGDGDTAEGLADEIAGLAAKLLTAITTYAKEQSGVGPICYGSGYPYWFKDANDNGTCDSGETDRYDTFTPRLLRAVYNYQVYKKDPGAFAHNGKYIIQLLYDSIMDLNSVLTTKVDMTNAVRNDVGHFNGAGEPARHWDEDDAVSASCSKCHGGSEGLTFFLQYGVGKSVLEQANGLDCATCHTKFAPSWETRVLDDVDFPGGKTVTDTGNKSNLCGACHSGRTGKGDIDASIAASSFRFLNVHYLPAAAIKAGTTAQVGYEYTGKTYSGPWSTHTGGSNCIDCHKPKESNHSFHIADVFAGSCKGCHASATKASDVRVASLHGADYDGDSNTTESLEDEIKGLAAILWTTFSAYATAGPGAICYDSHAYPYFFKDTNANGTCDGPGEANYGNRYTAWDATMMKAAHNYQIFQKEPGAWAHNFNYMAQLLYDSTEDLGGATAVTGLTRPAP